METKLRKLYKRILAGVLALVMILGGIPMNGIRVEAAETEEAESTTESLEAGLYDDGQLVYSWDELVGDEIIDGGVIHVMEGALYTNYNEDDDTNISSSVLNGTLVISDTITSMAEYAFAKCTELKEVQYSDNLTNVGASAFKNCISLEKIEIPNQYSISDSTFYGCISLKEIIIPEGVNLVRAYAFANCTGAEKLYIPEGFWGISSGSFANCSFSSIEVDEENMYLDSRDNCNAVIQKNGNKLILGCKNTIIPNTVECIGSYAFETESCPESVTIPSSVTDMSYAFYVSHSHAYEETVVEPTCTQKGYTEYLCEECGDKYVENEVPALGHQWKEVIDKEATVTSTGLKHEECTVCGEKQNENTVIDKLPSTEDSTTSPDENTDNETQNPSEDTTDNSQGNGNQTGQVPSADGENEIVYPSKGTVLTDTQLKAAFIVTEIGKTVSYTGTTDKKVTSITIPDTVTIDGVTYTVTAVAPNEFKNCVALKTIKMGAAIITIGNKAFYGCKKLTNITIKTTKLTTKNVGKQAFTKAGSNNYKKLTVKVPQKKLKAYKTMLTKKGVSKKAKVKK